MKIDRRTFAALLKQHPEARSGMTKAPTLKGMKPTVQEPRPRGPRLKYGRNTIVTGADAGKERM